MSIVEQRMLMTYLARKPQVSVTRQQAQSIHYTNKERGVELLKGSLNPLSESKYKTMPPATTPRAKTPLRRDTTTLNKL
jgi:hypothetical protein